MSEPTDEDVEAMLLFAGEQTDAVLKALVEAMKHGYRMGSGRAGRAEARVAELESSGRALHAAWMADEGHAVAMNNFEHVLAFGATASVSVDGFRKCEFCGCNTNAKLRRCCAQGTAADRGQGPREAKPEDFGTWAKSLVEVYDADGNFSHVAKPPEQQTNATKADAGFDAGFAVGINEDHDHAAELLALRKEVTELRAARVDKATPAQFESVARAYLSRMGNATAGPRIDREWPALAKVLASVTNQGTDYPLRAALEAIAAVEKHAWRCSYCKEYADVYAEACRECGKVGGYSGSHDRDLTGCYRTIREIATKALNQRTDSPKAPVQSNSDIQGKENEHEADRSERH